jgi:hypothetical protein
MGTNVTASDNSLDADIFERRATERKPCCIGALLRSPGLRGLFSCSVRDVSLRGASLRLHQQIALLPVELEFSDDSFRTTRRSRLIWRDSDFIGVAFVSH